MIVHTCNKLAEYISGLPCRGMEILFSVGYAERLFNHDYVLLTGYYPALYCVSIEILLGAGVYGEVNYP